MDGEHSLDRVIDILTALWINWQERRHLMAYERDKGETGRSAGTWSRYASGDHLQSPSGWTPHGTHDS